MHWHKSRHDHRRVYTDWDNKRIRQVRKDKGKGENVYVVMVVICYLGLEVYNLY